MDKVIDIGEQLLALRRARGMSQRELGERVGVLQPQVARWEADAYSSASLARVSAVAEALGLSFETSDISLAAESTAAYAPAGGAVASPLSRLGVDSEVVAAYCRSHSIVRLELFGSLVDGGFSAGSDVDVLATYAPGMTPGLMQLSDHETELSAIFRRKADLHTRAGVERSRNQVVRQRILGSARVVYEA